MRTISLFLVAFSLISCNDSKVENPKVESGATETLFPKGEKITNDNFTGTAYLQMLVLADSLNPTSVGNVTFEAGARTRWHSHPDGQILLITEGTGYYQEKGQPKKIIRKGETIQCIPNLPHWHGASLEESMSHLAISTNISKKPVSWLEKVTDEEYNSATR